MKQVSLLWTFTYSFQKRYFVLSVDRMDILSLSLFPLFFNLKSAIPLALASEFLFLLHVSSVTIINNRSVQKNRSEESVLWWKLRRVRAKVADFF